jgi:hypothetical protein
MDLLIAATAHAHGASVYTRNTADLASLEDLVDLGAARIDGRIYCQRPTDQWIRDVRSVAAPPAVTASQSAVDRLPPSHVIAGHVGVPQPLMFKVVIEV